MGYYFEVKNDITITNAAQKVLNQSGCKPNKVWVDKGIQFHNMSIKSWLKENYIKMH